VDDPGHVVEAAAEHAPVQGDERSYVKEDGTLVINILADRRCGPSTGPEIVVCAPDPAEHRLNAPEPPADESFKPELQLGENAKARARVEKDVMTGADRVMVDLVVKF
jgi:hypothetical protein